MVIRLENNPKIIVQPDVTTIIHTGTTINNAVGSGNTTVSIDGSTMTIYSPTGGTAAWGNINGTLSDQVDLQNALDLKLDTTALAGYWNSGQTVSWVNDQGFLTGTTGNYVTIPTFSAYTGTTNTRLNGIEDDITTIDGQIVYLSGQTDLRLKTADFNSYSASTQTTINGKALQTDLVSHTGNTDIHFEMSAITGFTSTNTFNTYTGTTAPSTYLGINALDGYWTSAQTSTYVTGLTNTNYNLITGNTANISTNTNYIQSLSATTIGDSGASKIGIPAIGTPTYTTQEQNNRLFASAGCVTDSHITDAGGGTINVSAGSGFIKQDDNDTSSLYSFDWEAKTGIAIPLNTTRFIGVVYSGGTPSIEVRTTETWNHDSEFALGSATNQNGSLHISDNPWQTTDSISHTIERLAADSGKVVRDKQYGGLVISESADTNRYVELTAGRLWSRFNKFSIDAVDTSGADTFMSLYRDGAGGWTMTSGLTQWDNLNYDDGSGTLAALTNNWYTNLWWYMTTSGVLHVVYGQEQYANPSTAEAATVPNVPTFINEVGILIGRFIIKQGETTAIEVQTAFDTVFTAAQAATHNNLAGLNEGDFLHLTATEYATIPDITGNTANIATVSGTTAQLESDFNTHTGNTDIHFEMSSITGFTSSDTFNAYTGATETELDSKVNKLVTIDSFDSTGGFSLNGNATSEIYELSGTSDITLSNINMSNGFQVTVVNAGTGTLTFVATSGVSIRSKDGAVTLTNQWGAASIYYNNNIFTIIGDLE